MLPTLSSLSVSGKSFIKNITDKNSYWTLLNVKFLRKTEEVYRQQLDGKSIVQAI